MPLPEPLTAQSPDRPLSGPHVLAAVEAYLVAAREEGPRHAHLLGTGAVARLERRLREHYGFAHALAVSSATAGLHALALALDLTGAEVVTTPLTYGGTVAGALHAGARLVFADVERDTLGLDPAATARALTPSTRAIVAADLHGVPADDRGLREVADANGLWYVHDAAQSFGAARDGRPAGSAAHAVVVSLSPGKALWAGEGGAVLTDDRELFKRLVVLTQHPYRQKREVGLGVADEFGLNARIHPLAAVWADADFEAALVRVQARRRAAERAARALADCGLVEPLRYAGVEPAYYRLTVVPEAGVGAGEVAQAMGWPTHGVAPLPLRPLYRHEAFRAWGEGSARPCPTAEAEVGRRLEVHDAVWTAR